MAKCKSIIFLSHLIFLQKTKIEYKYNWILKYHKYIQQIILKKATKRILNSMSNDKSKMFTFVQQKNMNQFIELAQHNVNFELMCQSYTWSHKNRQILNSYFV